MSAPAFRVGEAVFLASAGLGRVVDFAGRGEAGKPRPLAPGEDPEFYVVEVGDTVACVPLSRAEPLRRPVSEPEARAMLDVLRESSAPPAPLEPLLERGKKVVHSGTPLEHAHFLRELYGMPVPLSESVASGVVFFTKLVLPELAAVLGLNEAELNAEMRRRYPAAG